MVALAAPLRRLPALQRLWLFENGIGDAGLSALLAQPMSDVLPALEQLDLHNNRVGDAGCARLHVALERGALPALVTLTIMGNPCSDQAQRAVAEVLASRVKRTPASDPPGVVGSSTTRVSSLRGTAAPSYGRS